MPPQELILDSGERRSDVMLLRISGGGQKRGARRELRLYASDEDPYDPMRPSESDVDPAGTSDAFEEESESVPAAGEERQRHLGILRCHGRRDRHLFRPHGLHHGKVKKHN